MITGDFKQAIIWMEQGFSVRRLCWRYYKCPISEKWEMPHLNWGCGMGFLDEKLKEYVNATYWVKYQKRY